MGSPKRLLKISLSALVKTIVYVLLNEFDCFIVIEGGTGLGKSTLALHIAKRVRNYMHRLRKLDEETIEKTYNELFLPKGIPFDDFISKINRLEEEGAYGFKLKNDLIYSQKAMLKGLSSFRRIIIPDEMINITFNRDFFSEDQKNIIKMINMYRDHNNLIIACVPQFQTLDNQIKNLCKIRLSVVRRGFAIMQTPNRTIYGRDKWDQQTNEKIEREWLLKGVQNPSYARLTTCRGIIRFPKLMKAVEDNYQRIKDEKRTVILKNEMGIKGEEEQTIVQKAVDMLIAGKIRNAQTITGLAMSQEVSDDTFKKRLATELEKRGKSQFIADYYWDRRLRKQANAGVF